ncbi:golgin candidate 6-like isoform X5 [Solanum lycopersicum]
MAFGETGFHVILSILKEKPNDVQMVRNALETLLMAVTPTNYAKGPSDEVPPNLINSNLLLSEKENISILLSLLSHEDIHVRYATLQLLMPPLNKSPQKLLEVICSIPSGIKQLLNFLNDDCKLLRNEAMTFLTFLNCEAEEIQELLAFEGAFVKIFSIIEDEGGLEGGVVVQDCLILLSNLLHCSASNQAALREAIGFDKLLSVLKLRKATYSFSSDMTTIVLCVLEIINLLITGAPETDPTRDSDKLTNKTVLVQEKVLDYLFMLGVESQCAPVAVRCTALHCIGDLIADHPKNLKELASKRFGEEPDLEPALKSVFQMVLRTSSKQEFMAADYLFKNFCQRNPDGQTMLLSTVILQLQSMIHAPVENDINMSFGSHDLTTGENKGDLETCSRAASVLSHVIKGNNLCKEKVLHIELLQPTPILGSPEPLLHCMVKYLALASCMKSKDGKSSTSENVFVQSVILKLLIIWLSDCPNAVQCFLDSRSHLTYLLELVSSPTTTVGVRGLTAVLLGECVIYNKSNASGKDAYSIADAISQKVGFTSYFLKFDEMQKSHLFTSAKPFLPIKPLTRSTVASMDEIEYGRTEPSDEHCMLTSVFDSPFIYSLECLVADIREKMVEAHRSPKSQVTVVPADLEQQGEENDVDYIKRLKTFVEKHYHEIQSGDNKTLMESDAMIDLLVCLGQEQRKVDKLSSRLRELGEDVGKLLEDVVDDVDADEDD